jgi:uncharacterized protein involved in outer membrane biogenesis
MASRLLPSRKKQWPKILGGLLLTLAVLYFVFTSGVFIKAVVLPQVGSALNSELTADGVSLSPFSSLTLRQVKLTPKGEEPLATIALVQVRYSLIAILRGNVQVDEVVIDSPVITVVEHPDGTGNLANLLAGLGKSSKSSTKSASEPPRINIGKVSLKNATLRQTRQIAEGKAEFAEISGLEISLDQLGNGKAGRLMIAAGATLTKVTGDRLVAKTTGSFEVALDDMLMPKSVKGALGLDLTAATGLFKDFTGLGAALDLDASATELTQLRFAFRQQGQEVGRIALRGPFDLAKKETRITYEIAGIDRRVLGLAGAIIGFDFGATTVSATGRVDVAQLGSLIASNGRLTVADFSLGTTNGVTPALNVSFGYKTSVNLADKTALIEQADFSVKQAAGELVKGSLDRPMNVAWDKAQPGFREATYTVAIKGFELAKWRALAGPSLPEGALDLALKLTAQNDGRLLKFTLDSEVRDIAMAINQTRLSDLKAALHVDGALEEFNSLAVEHLSLDLRHGNTPVAALSSIINFKAKNREVGLQFNGELPIPAVLGLYPVKDVEFAKGLLKFSGQYATTLTATNASADVTLSDLTGRASSLQFKDYQARLSAAVNVLRGTVSLQRLNLALQSGFQSGGSFDLEGKYELAAKTGEVRFKSVNLNQNALAPFVAAAIAPNRLVSVALDIGGSAVLNLAGESSVKGDFKVSDFRAEDPLRRLPTSPLAFGLQIDAGQRGAVTDLRQLQLALGPTSLARNELRVAGKFDLNATNPAPSFLNVKSDGLDLTTLYNLFAGDGASTKAPAAEKPAAQSSSTASTAPAEPAPLKLPFSQFDFDLDVQRIYLREMAVSNWVAKAKLNQGVIKLDPFSLTLNGAPVTAKANANVGVPGYTYELAFAADKIPVPPISRSFLTGERLDLHGLVAAKADLKGAGITGPNLRKNLAGQIEFSGTGLDYQITALQSPLLKTLVSFLSTILRLPNVTQSPLDTIAAKVTAGQGNIDLTEARVVSPAVLVEARGRIQLADVITNSPINIPVSISVPKDGKYDKLPDLLTMKGTLGKPDPSYDPLAIPGILLRLPGGVGSAVGSGLNKLGDSVGKVTGGLLGGKPGDTNSPSKAGVLGGALNGLFGGSANTNAPAGDTNAPKPAFNPLDLFNKLKK